MSTMPLHRRIFLRNLYYAAWPPIHAGRRIIPPRHGNPCQCRSRYNVKKSHRCGSIRDLGSSTSNSERQFVQNRIDETKQRQRTPIRIVVAMSGGVDSSVAAHLLAQKQQKQVIPDVKVIGLHMSNWNALDEDSDEDIINHQDSTAKSALRSRKFPQHASLNTNHDTTPSSKSSPYYCEASEKEYHDASSVAQHLSIPLHRVSFASEYWTQVFEPFVESIVHEQQQQKDTNGQMMMLNPDFGCNTHIKFGTMKKYANDRLQADYVATGHYARLWHRDHYATLRMNKEGSNNAAADFYQWMEESTRLVGNSVMESIGGLPEEEWIMRNHLDHTGIADATANTTNTSSLHCPMLIAGADTSKDQSYFLSGVKTEAFRNVIFPLGHLIKSDFRNNNIINHHPQSVRELAQIANIPTATKRDSMGICFIGQRNFGNFISQYLPENMIATSSSPVVTDASSESPPRVFVDIDTGKILGHHRGMMHYTLGQGAKIPGVFVRYFVCGKGGGGCDSNTIYVCNSTHHPALYTDELYVDFDTFNWIGLGIDSTCGISTPPRPLLEGQSVRLFARTRHLQPLASCTVSWTQHGITSSGGKRGLLVVRFDNPIRAITPGQIVALYAGRDGLICLGGGVIGGKAASFYDRGMDVTLSDLHPSGHNDLSLLKYYIAEPCS